MKPGAKDFLKVPTFVSAEEVQQRCDEFANSMVEIVDEYWELLIEQYLEDPIKDKHDKFCDGELHITTAEYTDGEIYLVRFSCEKCGESGYVGD